VFWQLRFVFFALGEVQVSSFVMKICGDKFWKSVGILDCKELGGAPIKIKNGRFLVVKEQAVPDSAFVLP
jgi:hypothetical protein